MPALLRVLQDAHESDMVRHEAAEALGGIATPEVRPHLEAWRARADAPRVVRESCQVALDMWEVRFGFTCCCQFGCLASGRRCGRLTFSDFRVQYENSGEFQYANGLDGGLEAPAAAATPVGA